MAAVVAGDVLQEARQVQVEQVAVAGLRLMAATEAAGLSLLGIPYENFQDFRCGWLPRNFNWTET